MHLIANLRRLAARSSSLFIAVAASAPSTWGRVMGGFTLPVEAQWGDRRLPAGDYRFVVSSATSRARVYVRSDDSTMLFRGSIEWAPGAPGGHLCLVYDESGYRVRSLKLRDVRRILTFDGARAIPRPPEARRWSGVLYLPLKSPGDDLGNSQEHGAS